MSEIPKAYEPRSVEEKWYDFWVAHGCFAADPARVSEQRPAYSIVIPPPNVTGMLHLGHVLNNTIQDILARKARLDGKEVLWLPGTDHAGIATQAVVERTLKKQGVMKHRDELGREKFLEYVWQWKEKHGGIIIEQLKKLGCSCDWSRLRFTMDPEYSRCVQKVFVDLYKKGLIYRGKRMVNWDPAAHTALSDEEVEMIEEKGRLWHIKYPLLDERGQPIGGEFVIVATTRPETMLGDEAVAVNPNDERYRYLIGRSCRLPLQNKSIPIVGDDVVDPKFGTGCVKVTPAHDPADYEIAMRHNLPLTVVIAPDGAMTREAGEAFAGLDRKEARQAVVQHLTQQGLLLKTEDYVHNVGYSQRSHVPIEPYLSEQWFLKYPSVEEAMACVELGRTPDKSAPMVPISGRDQVDGGVSYPGTKKTALGGKPLVAQLPKEKLGIQPAPRAELEVADLLAEVNRPVEPTIRFHPDRWAKTYAHWMRNIRDWCISRQLWWGHRVPVWYSEGWDKLDRRLVVVCLTGKELAGRNIHELRRSAFQFAREQGVLGQGFLNLDTQQLIAVQKSGLEHGFSNFGVANVKLVPGLPQLLRHAIRITVEPHVPPTDHVKSVETYLAALRVGDQFFRVKFRVKVFPSNLRLYDHQTVLLWRETREPDGNKSPEENVPGDKTSRPASGSEPTLVELAGDVNTSPAFTRCQIESPGPGWEQDPDVLDTWASAWLWPFATMGWPEQTETLKKFYPTTDLVTGPDILFFWVARMIMAGHEYMGDVPFRNVYFTGIIRDKLGRKMSKSLGNSPDPLELIGKYGADALRFGTMRSAPLGQDVLFDEKEVELGRNFCNKLWNVCRFRQMQGGESEGEINPALLTSDDKWILLRLDQAIREIDDAFASYRFNEVTQTLYRFFWSEFCDWYIEASKAVLARPLTELNGEKVESEIDLTMQPFNNSTHNAAALRANKLAVIDFVLSHTLRLFHPFLPFITEELWQGMGFHQELPARQGGETIMFARWPKPLEEDFKTHYGLDESDERFVNAKYEMVKQGRNLRRESNIASSKRVKFILKPVSAWPPQEAEVLKILLNAEPLEIDPGVQPGKGTPSVRAELGELYLPLEGLIDVAAEKARLVKELEKIEGEIAKVQQKLDNPAFVQKVPPAVLAEQHKRRADWQAKRSQVRKALDDLASS